MKIVRYSYGKEEGLAFVVGNGLVPFKELGLPNYIEYPFSKEELRLPAEIKEPSIGLAEVRLLSPVKYPGKIVGLGLNFVDHAREQGKEPPNRLLIFLKPRTALAGPFDTIKVPNFVTKLDYEGELAFVIGRRGKHIPRSEAFDYILGYTVMNDVSARDIQFADKQWTRGKGFDGFAPLGPWIVTKDEVPDPGRLQIRTWVNGELRQNGNTSNMVFDVPAIVSEISQAMTLEPGDVIATGTPAGVGIFMKPEPKLLKHGDVVEIEVEKVGKIRNKFEFYEV